MNSSPPSLYILKLMSTYEHDPKNTVFGKLREQKKNK